MDQITSSSLQAHHLFFPCFLLVLSILLFILRHIKPTFSKKLSLPPGPNPWPIIGNIFLLGKKPHRSLHKLAQTYGPLISLKLGTQICVVASSTIAAQKILKTHDRLFSARHVSHSIPAKNPEFNHLSIVWSSECTDQWKFLRTICRTEIFSTKAIESQANLRERKVKEMIDYLTNKEGKEVKIVELAFTTIINVVSGICFSKDFINIHDEENVSGLKELMRKIIDLTSVPNAADFFPILGGMDVQGLQKKVLECVTTLFTSFDVHIKERKQGSEHVEGSTQEDVLDVLLAKDFTNDAINYFILDLFLAGGDTSSTTVEWLMLELIRNEEVMKKVKEELAREIKNDFVKESDLPRLSYLNACVKETFRLHTPAPIIHRKAIETCEVMNYSIPKNAQVFVNVWAIGRDPDTWEDPLTFKPCRFLNADVDFKGNDFELIPFGAGRRICPGIPLAAKGIHLIVASLVQSFDWYLPNNISSTEMDMNEIFGISLRKEQPLLLIPKIRKL